MVVTSAGTSAREETITSYASLLRECNTLSHGKSIHEQILSLDLHDDTYLSNLVLQMYGRCGDLHSARDVFDRIPRRNVFSWTLMLLAYARNGHLREARIIFDAMPDRSVVSWNTMISSYAQCGKHKVSLELVAFMDLDGVRPSDVTVLIALEACGNIQSISAGRAIHQSSACDSALEKNVGVGAALVTMYGKAGSVREAELAFRLLPEHNVVIWTAMLGAYIQQRWYYEAVVFFLKMVQEGVRPDVVSIISVLDACASYGSSNMSSYVFTSIVQAGGYMKDVRIGNAAINMFGKCECVERAKFVFDAMPWWNVVSWTSMVSAYSQNEEFHRALDLFVKMDMDGVFPDTVTFVSTLDACGNLKNLATGKLLHEECEELLLITSNLGIATSLINMYAKCKETEVAKKAFDAAPRAASSYNALISAYVQNQEAEKAMNIFRNMDLDGVQTNKITLVTILDACANVPGLSHHKFIHSTISGSEAFRDISVTNALVNMYGKCGRVEMAWSVFEKVLVEADIVTWTTMVETYAQNGYSDDAIRVFQQMQLQGLIPNVVTFTSIISACTHTGLLDLGFFFFCSQVSDYGLGCGNDQPFVGVVDLLGRAGGLVDAEKVVGDMPFQPHSAVLVALLAACRVHGDCATARRVAQELFLTQPRNRALYQLLSNMYIENQFEPRFS